MTILVIDDNNQFYDYLLGQLEPRGDLVLNVTTEDDAEIAIIENDVDLIISEQVLENYRWLRFKNRLNQICGNRIHIPVILFSEFNSAEIEDSSINMIHHVVKSSNLMESYAVLLKIVEQFRKINEESITSEKETFSGQEPTVIDADELAKSNDQIRIDLELLAEKYDFLSRTIESGYWEWQPVTDIFFIDPLLKTLLGYLPEEITDTGKFWETLIHPDDAALFNDSMENLINHKIPELNINIRLIHRTGNFIWINLQATLVRIGANATKIIKGIYRNITVEKENSQNLFVSKRLEGIGRLATGIAHDFNNALTTILGNLELISPEFGEIEEQPEEFNEIRKAAKRATWLTRQLLLYSRKQALKPSFINLSKIVENMYKLLRRLVDENIQFTLQLTPESDIIKADETQIEQLIMNLIINLVSFIPCGGHIIIETNSKIIKDLNDTIPPGEYMEFNVQINQIKNSAVSLKVCQEPLNEKTIPGISLILELISQNDGYFSKEITSNNYLKLKALFPIVKTQKSSEEEKIVPLRELHGNQENILVVEDEKAILDFVCRSLKEYNYNTFSAEDAESAKKIFHAEKDKLDMIFCDVILPDQNGLELVSEIIPTNPNLAIVMTSGYSDQKSRWNLINEKGFRFLPKPYTLPELLSTIRATLKASREITPTK